MLRAERITVDFGGVRAVAGVDLEVGAKEMLGLVGPNGSGKTTLLNAVCGVVAARGALTVDGRRVRLSRPAATRAAGIARVFQAPQIFDELSCLENVLLSSPDGRLVGLVGAVLARPAMHRREHRREAAALRALTTVGLAEYASTSSKTLSYGQRRLLELARALAAEPKVLLLDEPSAGLNDAESAQLAQLLRETRDAGLAVVVVDHKIDFLDSLCDRLVVLELGKVIAQGPPDEVWRHQQVINAYLGVAGNA
ncbi:ATP-binding cassette domain-containing protein [Dactylosporangium sp. NBC_01737]|uniref:ABC transporter ATP-binding protein n=1 Tax=Dactylosporangium sp. NBC_01737 TaxID=2975959 RepID=UPI002E0D2CEA|nr:ATP-binding cassette domain-containing protein [Dactylosporangium sp. NBC_01737]